MKKTTNQATRLPLAGSLLLLACITGCASSSPDLRLTCTETGATYRQQFSNAYLSKGAEGTEVVLISEDNVASNSDSDSSAVAAGQTLEPSTATAVRQVMHLKVLWRPQRGTKQGHPSYTNAALRWYVLGENGNGKSADVLEYTGAGFVALSDTVGGTQVTIRNASLKPVGPSNGSLNDPIGAANLTGKFLAKRSAKRVNELLAEVKSAVNGASAQQASAH